MRTDLLAPNGKRADNRAFAMVADKRFLSLAGECLMGANEIVIEVKHDFVGSLALELTLLLSGLIESLRIRPDKGCQLVLTLTDSDRISKAIVTCISTNTLSFRIGRNQAEYLQAVLLRAYRDQMAEVNHVHIEGQRDGKPFDLTVMFEFARGPVSPKGGTKAH